MQPFRVLNAPELIEISEKERELFARIGQILKAQVVEQLSEKRFFLRFGEKLVMAEAMVPLEAGKEIKVRVEALRPKITLKLLPLKARADVGKQGILNAIAQKQDLSSLIERMLSLKEVPDLQKIIKDIIANKEKLQKKDFWQNLGKVLLGRSEKGEDESSLQRILTSLFNEARAEHKKILADFLSQFEIIKTINAHLKQEEIYLQIPYMGTNQAHSHNIEILISKEKREKNLAGSFKRAYLFQFRMCLEALGKIEGKIRLPSENEMFIYLSTEREDTAKFIESQVSLLKKNLEKSKFILREFLCQAQPDNEKWRQDFCLSLLKLGKNFLDLRA